MDADRLANARRNAYNGYADPADVLDLIRELAVRDTPCVWTPVSVLRWQWNTACGHEGVNTNYGDFCPYCGHLVQISEVTT